MWSRVTQEEGLGLREEEEGGGGGGGRGRGWQQLTCTTCGTPQSGGPFSASLNSTAASMLVQHADPCMYHNMSLWELALSSLSHHSAVLKARHLYSLTFVYTCVQCRCGVCVFCLSIFCTWVLYLLSWSISLVCYTCVLPMYCWVSCDVSFAEIDFWGHSTGGFVRMCQVPVLSKWNHGQQKGMLQAFYLLYSSIATQCVCCGFSV